MNDDTSKDVADDNFTNHNKNNTILQKETLNLSANFNETNIILIEDKIDQIISEFLLKAEREVYIFTDLLLLPISLLDIFNDYKKIKDKSIKVKLITNVNKDTLSICKRLNELCEIRHHEEIGGSFAICDSEYLAIDRLTKLRNSSLFQITFSKSVEIGNKNKSIFEKLWNISVPLEQKIEEFQKTIERTEVVYDKQTAAEMLINLVSNAKTHVLVCGDEDLPLFHVRFKELRDIRPIAKSKGVEFRYITNITRNNIRECRKMMEIGKIRHSNQIKGWNFCLCDDECYLFLFGKNKITLKSAIYTNSKSIVEQQKKIFETLWEKSISAVDQIKLIEEGIETEISKIISDREKTRILYLETIDSAKQDIYLIYPSFNSIIRDEKIGALNLLKQKATQGIKIKILSPDLEDVKYLLAIEEDNISQHSFTKFANQNHVETMINKKENLRQEEIKSTVIVIDRKYLLTIELEDDSAIIFEDAIGLCTYSNSKPTVLSQVFIFEKLWTQIELSKQLIKSKKELEDANELLKIKDRMQRDFINVAAHELRSPAQAILGYAELASLSEEPIIITDDNDEKKESDNRDNNDNHHNNDTDSNLYNNDSYSKDVDANVNIKVNLYIEPILRNAKRLHKLTENLLEIARIESNTIRLRKEEFNLVDLLLDAIRDVQKQNNEKINGNIQFSFYDKIHRRVIENRFGSEITRDDHNAIFINADRERIAEVVSNLLHNAVKFTKEGKIEIIVEKHFFENNKEGIKEEIMVSIKDTGIGIPEEIIPKLFEKFVTTSNTGTGLGLFISKNIITEHGGCIWVENNPSEKGTVFKFTLPSK